MALIDWANGDLFSALRDKFNAVRVAVSSLAGGTIGQIWTKDSSTDFDGTFKSAETVINSGLPTRTGNKRKALLVKTDETGYELDSGTTGFVNIATQATGFITLSTATYTTLNNGAGTSLSYTLPNDSKTRKFWIVAMASYENGVGESTRIFTRIANNGTAVATGFRDLRAMQDEFNMQYVGSIVCTGQTITVDAKLQDAGTDSSFTFNGGSVAVMEIL